MIKILKFPEIKEVQNTGYMFNLVIELVEKEQASLSPALKAEIKDFFEVFECGLNLPVNGEVSLSEKAVLPDEDFNKLSFKIKREIAVNMVKAIIKKKGITKP